MNGAETSVARRRELGVGLLLSAVTMLGLLAILEGVGYIWEKRVAQERWALVASRRMPLVSHGQGDDQFYLLTPNSTYNWEGIDVHINQRGLRSPDLDAVSSTDKVTILNLGDSVAFGWEVGEEETYGQRLAAQLNAADGDQVHQVVNAGVPGWNPAMEHNFLRTAGLAYEPDIVVLEFTVVNDVYGMGPAIDDDEFPFGWLRDHTYLWPFLTTNARFFLAGRQGPEAIPVLNPPADAASYFPLEADRPRWSAVWDEIEAMADLLDQRDVPLVLVFFPTALQLNSAGHPLVPQQVLGDRAAERGIPVVDLTPVFAAECDRLGKRACEGFENALFADVWMHPNAEGHALAADALAAHFQELR